MEYKDRFIVKFRGIRGSYPTPKAECLKYGGNTSCVEVRVNNHLIILDAGTGIIGLGGELIKEHVASGSHLFERKPIYATILLTHIHQDHIQGFTFFNPSHILTTELSIFGNTDYLSGIEESLSSLLFNKSFPLDMGDLAAKMEFADINDTNVIVLNNDSPKPVLRTVKTVDDLVPVDDEVIISFYKSYSHPQNGVLIYKIAYKDKSVVFATDKEDFIGGDKKLILFARNSDLLIHDAQYTTEDYISPISSKQGFGHSTFDMAIEVAKQTHAKKLAFFHIDPSYNDEKVESIEKYYQGIYENCFVAREGQEIEIM